MQASNWPQQQTSHQCFFDCSCLSFSFWGSAVARSTVSSLPSTSDTALKTSDFASAAAPTQLQAVLKTEAGRCFLVVSQEILYASCRQPHHLDSEDHAELISIFGPTSLIRLVGPFAPGPA